MNYDKKVFNDAIHGSIEIHPLCIKVIDTLQFQRLRFIKQLGFTYFVYPAASHCRFEHSLGVCHLAGVFARFLRDRQPELEINEVDILCVELAGLCHDLGHGPFSHLWEMFMQKIRPKSSWKSGNNQLLWLLPLWKQVVRGGGTGLPIGTRFQEDWEPLKRHITNNVLFGGCFMLTQENHLIAENGLESEFQKHNLSAQDIVFIKELILRPKKSKGDGQWPYEGRPREKGFLYQIVSNSENGIDVDKWDYFLRDAQSLGLQVTFLYERLMKFARVINVSQSSVPDLKICFRDKEAVEIPEMFRSRLMLHQKAYQHRVVRIIDAMIIESLVLANEHVTYQGSNGKQLSLCDASDDPVSLTQLQDDVFHRIQCHASTSPQILLAKQILCNILTRRYYPLIGIGGPIVHKLQSADFLNMILKNLPSTSSLKASDIEVSLVLLNYGSGSTNPILKVGTFSKANPNVVNMINPSQVSHLLPNLWEERKFLVLLKRYEADLLQEAKEAFEMATKQLSQIQVNSNCH